MNSFLIGLLIGGFIEMIISVRNVIKYLCIAESPSEKFILDFSVLYVAFWWWVFFLLITR